MHWSARAPRPRNGLWANRLSRTWHSGSASRLMSWPTKDWSAPAEAPTSTEAPQPSEPQQSSLTKKHWTRSERPQELDTPSEKLDVRAFKERGVRVGGQPEEKVEKKAVKKATHVASRQGSSPNWFDFVSDEGASQNSVPSGPDDVTQATWKGPKVIFSGIQPTGVPHLGNYLGALRTWRELQEAEAADTRLIFSIVDLHSLTMPPRLDQGAAARRLRMLKRQTLAALLAIGLDPARCTIFYQSTVPAHSELQWILSCSASMGYLNRMTQWKSKLQLPLETKGLDDEIRKKLKHGLFSYPILQAADILIHRATHVPVGEDQSQHLEFTRECATSFNHMYGRVFPHPETILAPARRIMSLQDPAKKMSKSDTSEKSRILLTDSEDDIRKKMQSAVTDSTKGVSYEPNTRPAVANLLNIWSAFDPDKRSPVQLTEGTEGWNLGTLKKHATDSLVRGLGDMRERYLEYLSRDVYLDEVLEEGTRKAAESAEATMKAVRDAVGLGNFSGSHQSCDAQASEESDLEPVE